MIVDSLLLFEPRIGAQPEHVVVREARAAERPGKNHFLLGRRVAPETVRALDVHVSHHNRRLCKMQGNADAEQQPTGCAPFLPGLKAEVSRSKI